MVPVHTAAEVAPSALHSFDIIIVNRNAGDDLRHCLQSVASACPPTFPLGQVILIDNASTDGSADGLGPASLPLRLVRNATNRGFAAACNQGALLSSAEFLLFLNPDTRLPSRSVEVPLGLLSGRDGEGIGICGIQLRDEQGRIHRSCMRFPTPGRLLAAMLGMAWLAPASGAGYMMRDWTHTESRTVDIVSGAFFLVRRSLFASLGGFDERYFLYFEEADFSLRAAAAGWRTVYVADVHAIHRGSRDWQVLDAWKLFHSARSRIVFSVTHFSRLNAILVSAGILSVEPSSYFVANLLRGSVRRGLEAVAAYLRLWTCLPKLLRKGGAP